MRSRRRGRAHSAGAAVFDLVYRAGETAWVRAAARRRPSRGRRRWGCSSSRVPLPSSAGSASRPTATSCGAALRRLARASLAARASRALSRPAPAARCVVCGARSRHARARARLRRVLGRARASCRVRVRSLRTSTAVARTRRRACGVRCCRRTCAPRARSAGSPAAPRRVIVHALKYGGWHALGARRWRSAWRALRWPPRRRSRERTALVPVPLSASRATRARLQPERACSRAGSLAGGTFRCGTIVLARTRVTTTANAVDTGERLRNVSGAFRRRSRDRGALRGAHLVLVDDVVTTARDPERVCAQRCSTAAHAS